MSNRSKALIALLVLSALVVYLVWPTDESRIKKLFREGAKAVEAKKVDDIMSKVSYNYRDDHGLSYLVLRQNLGSVLARMSNISVEYEIRKLDIKDRSAAAEVEIRVIATFDKDTGYVLGDAARPVKALVTLEKERTKWLVSRTEGLLAGF